MTRSNNFVCLAAAAAAALSLAACDKAGAPTPDQSASTPSASNTAPPSASTPDAGPATSPFPATLFVTSIDGSPTPIADAKASAKEGDTVILTGHIGGREDPFVAGRAAFTLVDPVLKPCTDGCKTPWDFCCDSQSDIAKHAATIQVVDASGQVIKSDLKNHRGIKPGAQIVVSGTVAKRDNPAVLVVNANQIWVKGS